MVVDESAKEEESKANSELEIDVNHEKVLM